MKHVVVGPKGGAVSFVDSDGEVLLEVAVPAGVHPLSRFAALRPSGAKMVLPGIVVPSLGNAETCKPVGQFESAANPFFRVSPAARQVRELKRLMRRTEALAKRAVKAQAALERAKAAPPPAQLPPPDAEPVDGGEG